jgi:hypothetical protein
MSVQIKLGCHDFFCVPVSRSPGLPYRWSGCTTTLRRFSYTVSSECSSEMPFWCRIFHSSVPLSTKCSNYSAHLYLFSVRCSCTKILPCCRKDISGQRSMWSAFNGVVHLQVSTWKKNVSFSCNSVILYECSWKKLYPIVSFLCFLAECFKSFA